MPNYRWESPYEWLEDAIHDRKVSANEALYALMEFIDPDNIQEIFQAEMERDGYFEDRNEMCVCGHKRSEHNEDDLYCEAGVFDEAGRLCGDCECDGFKSI